MKKLINKKILVTGSNGMLGKDIVNVFLSDQGAKVYGADLSRDAMVEGVETIGIDLLNGNELKTMLQTVDPDVIIHCAANVDVDDCEKNRAKTQALHVEVTGQLASYKSGNSRFIYISTDSVYGNKAGDHLETDRVQPINYYAQSKYDGEQAALAANPSAIVLRTNIYGFHRVPKRSLVEWAIDNWRNGKRIDGFSDVWFNPVYTKQLARMIKLLLVGEKLSGVLNIGAKDKVSKYEFLLKLAGVFGYPQDMVRESTVGSCDFIAPRPRDTTMNTDKLRSIMGDRPDLLTGLREMKNDLQCLAVGGN